jgi:hypothetical protein
MTSDTNCKLVSLTRPRRHHARGSAEATRQNRVQARTMAEHAGLQRHHHSDGMHSSRLHLLLGVSPDRNLVTRVKADEE